MVETCSRMDLSEILSSHGPRDKHLGELARFVLYLAHNFMAAADSAVVLFAGFLRDITS